MQKLKDMIVKLFSGEDGRKRLLFLSKYGRYILAFILFLIWVLILARCTGPSKHSQGEKTTEADNPAADFVLDKDFKTDEITAVNELLTTYFDAYANDDLDTLSRIAIPMSDNEKSFVGVYSQYIKKYKNISCDTKSGLTAGSYLVSVYYEIKFYGVKTLAPGRDFFYVETDDSGNLFINNLYSKYNLSRVENPLDPEIYSVINQFQSQEDEQALLADAQSKYEEAVSSDEDLAKMVSTTLPAAMEDWARSIQEDTQTGTEEPQEGTETSQSTDQAATGTSAGAAETADTTKAKKQKVRTTTQVYVREGPSTDSTAYKLVAKGKRFIKLGEEGDWTKVKYGDGSAYVKTEFLEDITE